jgi:hypothetical protein
MLALTPRCLKAIMPVAMIDLYDELAAVVRSFERSGVDYALCGGLALAVHGVPRATNNIDVLIPVDQVKAARAAARSLGYELDEQSMRLADGAVKIEQVSKADPEGGDALSLALVLVTPALREAWEGRRRALWDEGELTVVAKEGLIAMKQLRGSGRDLDDIESLEGEGHGD